MKNITIRVTPETENWLSSISEAPTSAVQTAIEVFMQLHRKTLNELKNKFSREEIIGMADSMNGLLPTWQLMVNPQVFAAHTEDAERYENAISKHGANFETLIDKIETLTPAQATILQLELWSFWNRSETTSPDLEILIKKLS